MDDQAIRTDPRQGPATSDGAWGTGLKLESAFRDAVSAAVRESLTQGTPVPVTKDDGTVEWLFPDGLRRPTPT